MNAHEQLANSLGQLILIWQRQYRDILLHHKLSAAEKRILYGLYHNPGITKKKLAELIVLEASSVTRAMQRLEKNGHLTRLANQSDRRAATLCLSELGKQKTRAVKRDFMLRFTQAMPEEKDIKVDEVIGYIESLTENLKHQKN